MIRAAILFSFSLLISFASATTLSERQAQNYIEQIITSVEYTFSPYVYTDQLRRLKRDITNILTYNGLYSYSFNGKRFEKELIDQYLASAIVEFIEQQAYEYAYTQLKNMQRARKIAESMRNNAVATISQTGYINPNQLSDFIGPVLDQAIAYELNSGQQYYTSRECCVCYSSFDNARRIYLRPCGHDICAECAYMWFFGDNNSYSKTCPICRSFIDLDALSTAISAGNW